MLKQVKNNNQNIKFRLDDDDAKAAREAARAAYYRCMANKATAIAQAQQLVEQYKQELEECKLKLEEIEETKAKLDKKKDPLSKVQDQVGTAKDMLNDCWKGSTPIDNTGLLDEDAACLNNFSNALNSVIEQVEKMKDEWDKKEKEAMKNYNNAINQLKAANSIVC